MNAWRGLAERMRAYDFDVVVVGLHLRWDGVYQRPQHVLSRIARHVPVIVVEEPEFEDGIDLPEWIVDGNVSIYRPHRLTEPPDALDERTLSDVRERIGDRRALLWLYTPMMAGLIDALAPAPLVFDAMDELAQFAQADPRLADRESRVLREAALVFCGGPSIYRARAERAKHVALYSSGVDVGFFERARSLAPHALLTALPRPVFGYIGVIDERLDLDLIAAVADAYPRATLAMIGPTAKIEASVLPRRPNIRYLGKQQYADLPALLAGIDVALMPFALNDSTRNISPTKTLEYLAAGKPIVSTAVPDVVSEYAGLVSIAGNTATFVSEIAAAPQRAAERRSAADERTRRSTWDAIVTSMLNDLQEHGIVAQRMPVPT